jgi:hypothetical protein
MAPRRLCRRSLTVSISARPTLYSEPLLRVCPLHPRCRRPTGLPRATFSNGWAVVDLPCAPGSFSRMPSFPVAYRSAPLAKCSRSAARRAGPYLPSATQGRRRTCSGAGTPQHVEAAAPIGAQDRWRRVTRGGDLTGPRIAELVGAVLSRQMVAPRARSTGGSGGPRVRRRVSPLPGRCRATIDQRE